MPNESPDDELLYTADVAKIHGVDVRTVHRWVETGKLKPAARGRGLRGSLVFHRSDVDALEHQVAS
jgi:DNA-binding transcriptional MerR regulator